MAENHRTATYANGEPISIVTDSSTWSQLSSGAWCNYNNNVANDGVYGKLYNWYATVDSRDLCPAGWHVPTDAEWTVLTDYLGGTFLAGGKMKSTGTQYWLSPNVVATNESGFSGFPGGYRFGSNGGFYVVGNDGYWWSSTENPTYGAWSRWLKYNNGNVGRSTNNKQDGFSVRCLKD
jgi:uncharacterized protein (TIGR02145 family)